MTWSIALIGLVATVSLMHLAVNTAHALTRLRGHRSLEQRQTMAAGGARGDWYVFFHCSDLTGKGMAKKMPEQNERRQVAGATPARRALDRRPRSGISL